MKLLKKADARFWQTFSNQSSTDLLSHVIRRSVFIVFGDSSLPVKPYISEITRGPLKVVAIVGKYGRYVHSCVGSRNVMDNWAARVLAVP